MASSRSRRPHSAPTPVGPSILWALQATKSAPRAATSVGRWGIIWAASTTVIAPTARAAAATSATGGMVPSTLDMPEMPTTLTRSSSRAGRPLEVHPEVGGQGQVGQFGAGVAADQLPGHDVGVVLQGGEQDAVAGAQVVQAPAVGHGVDRRGGAAGEDDLPRRGGVEEGGHLGPGPLVQVGRLLGQGVGPAVDVGVVPAVVVVHGVEHLDRLLGGGRRVEVDQRPAVHLPLQQGEVGPQVGEVAHSARSGRKAS